MYSTLTIMQHRKHGVAALPSQEAFRSWLDENKDKFVKHNSGLTMDVSSPFPMSHGGCVAVVDTRTETPIAVTLQPGAGHLALKPGEDRICPPIVVGARQREFRRAPRCGGGAIHCIRCAAASVLRRAAMVLDPRDFNRQQGRRQRDTSIPSLAGALPAAAKVTAAKEISQTHTSHSTKAAGKKPARLAAPPSLDPRFFYPDGRLRAAYRHLEAQVPLPMQWVSWAIDNGHHEVPGRGNIRNAGIAAADETFDYDALHLALHRHLHRTGHPKIASSARAELLRDDPPAAAAFHHFSLQDPPASRQYPPIEDSLPHGLDRGAGNEKASETLGGPRLLGSETPESLSGLEAGPVLRVEAGVSSAPLTALEGAGSPTAAHSPKKNVRFAVDSGSGLDSDSASRGGSAASTATSCPSSSQAAKECRSGAPSPEALPFPEIAGTVDEAPGTSATGGGCA
ncbi:hypothetical protein F4820DRAFT_211927 [Hypoxylon rubiginosum]|uniref:Uncharacterized protein n=1 Tax=Hypoxylon rubiginosum TaxID=110542 RepID=A0ACB9YHI2_9PEZI|nr:hypothetical protein F4820DRAFT_211927 [Hypoxylon rubiginosum]